jgi:uncharacterized protein (TIGR00290 family)
MPKQAAVLWTGGKDCNLALHEAKQAGYAVKYLVTFIMGDGKFKAHPLTILQMQAEALTIPYLQIAIKEPYKESYEKAIANLKAGYGIETLITGDIAEIHGNSNWITDRSKPAGVEVYLPLWHMNRQQLLERLFTLNFTVIFSCVKKPWFTSEWLGKRLDREAMAELKKINNLDICGEQGEYHTLVLDGPGYNGKVEISKFNACKEEEIMYMDITNAELKPKHVIA